MIKKVKTKPPTIPYFEKHKKNENFQGRLYPKPNSFSKGIRRIKKKA